MLGLDSQPGHGLIPTETEVSSCWGEQLPAQRAPCPLAQTLIFKSGLWEPVKHWAVLFILRSSGWTASLRVSGITKFTEETLTNQGTYRRLDRTARELLCNLKSVKLFCYSPPYVTGHMNLAKAQNTDSNGRYQTQTRKFKSWLDTTSENIKSAVPNLNKCEWCSVIGVPAAYHDKNLKTG